MDALTIQEAAETTGWSSRMLRYIERSGLVAPPRSESGYRLYGPAELQRRRDATRRVTATNAAIRAATGDTGDYDPVPITQAALAAYQDGGSWYVRCAEADSVRAEDAAGSAASWTLLLADPGGVSSATSASDRAEAFVVRHQKSGLVIGDPSTALTLKALDGDPQVPGSGVWKLRIHSPAGLDRH